MNFLYFIILLVIYIIIVFHLVCLSKLGIFKNIFFIKIKFCFVFFGVKCFFFNTNVQFYEILFLSLRSYRNATACGTLMIFFLFFFFTLFLLIFQPIKSCTTFLYIFVCIRCKYKKGELKIIFLFLNKNQLM